MINKIRHKKGAKILDIIIMAFLGIMFFGGVLFFSLANAEKGSLDIPEDYRDNYDRLNKSQQNLSDTVDNIRDSVQGVTEATNIVQVAFNGLKGILAIFQLPLRIITPVTESINLALDMTGFMPSLVTVTIILIITVIMVFAILKLITQRGNDA